MAAIGLVLSISAAMASAKEVLRILTWPGYAEPEQVKLFEKRFDVTLDISYVGADDELWQRASRNQGRNFDLIALNTATLQRFIDQNLLQAIDVSQIPNLKRQLPRFRNIAAISRDDKVFAVPYAHSAMGLIFNKKLVKTPPTSMSELWNPAYKDKVLAYDGSAHNFSLAAMQLGFRDPFSLNQKEMVASVSKLVELRRNVLKFYKTPEEVVEIYRESPIALIYANYGEQQVSMLRKAGADIGYVIPKEGALAWLDCWAIMSGASNPELAHEWINFTLGKEMSRQLTVGQGLANTVQESNYIQAGDKIIWIEPVENAAERASLWSRITSGHKKDGY
jgi:putative spermidine/putrescine transport system substrate-binding protein